MTIDLVERKKKDIVYFFCAAHVRKGEKNADEAISL
jgi:hypothetical protein